MHLQGISIREFARRDGCSDTLVHRALKSKHLQAFQDGSLDPALVGTGWRPANRRAQKPANTPANTRADVCAGESLEEAAHRAVVVEGRAPYSLAEAERIKENYLALLRELEYDRESASVVAVADVVSSVAAEYAVVRNAMLGLPPKLAPRLAMMRSAEEVRALLEAEIVQVLEALTRDGGTDVPDGGEDVD